MNTIATTQKLKRDILTVSQFTVLARQLLEDCFPLIWVEGEISNLAKPSSGHIYFSLKDNQAQVRCALFKSLNKQVACELQDGLKVLVRAKASLYPPRGDFQLIVESIEEIGSGALQRAFEQLKKKLADEGLFDQRHKKLIPGFPKTIGVITSPTGAAIRDILSVLKRRAPAIPVIVYPSLVQGDQAASQLVTAIECANRHKACDILILARGGGSLEDLWPFNEEILARAIFKSTIPIVSGVGHEIDFTIADFVADRRAPTPSAAAEMLSPDRQQWQQHLTNLAIRLQRHIRHLIAEKNHGVKLLHQQLRHPQIILREQSQRVDSLEQHLRHLMTTTLHRQEQRLTQLRLRFQHLTPFQQLNSKCEKLMQLTHHLLHLQQNVLHQAKIKLMGLSRALQAISPLATLERGYAIVKNEQDKILLDATNLNIADRITAILFHGKIVARVEEIDLNDPPQKINLE